MVAGLAQAQEVTSVESFGVARASEVKAGLGFNVEPRNDWEFQIAKGVGATYVRFDCGWATTEKQNADNTSGGFALSAACVKGLESAKRYGLKAEIDALYGPPFRTAVTAKVNADVPVGAYELPLTVTKGSLSALEPLRAQVKLERNKDLTVKHTYSGSLITGVDAAQGTVTLASATNVALPAGTVVLLNQLLYPPILTKSADAFRTDASVMAFGRYAHFLAEAMHQAGVQGEVGLWNEPDWSGDLWDHGGKLFDTPPAGLVNQPNIPLYVATMTPVEGVVFDNGYTEKSGNGSIYTPDHLKLVASVVNARKTVAWESFHPYGNTPEDHFWYPACLKKLVDAPNAGGRAMKECAAVGVNASSNVKMAVMDSMLPAAGGGAQFNITETGLCRSCNKVTTEEQVARFNVRQFVGFEGLGVSPIMFYRLAEKPKDGFGWVDFETHQPLPVFQAFQGLMADVAAIAGPAAATCAVPQVTAYKGTYPLATVAFVGTKTGDSSNSVLLFTWQRSYTTPREKPWVEMAGPAAVPVEVGIPQGMELVGVKDAVTGMKVAYHFHSSRESKKGTAQSVTYEVADDPVEVWVQPRRATKVVDAAACEVTR